MVDYVTLRTYNKKTAKTLKEKLPLERKLFEETGEILKYGNKEFAKLHNMNFTVFDSGLTEITGSLHSFYNALHGIKNDHGEPMNHDDFTYIKVYEIIKELMETFNLIPEQTRIHHIEFGVNLSTLPFSTNTVLNSLIAYKNKPFSPMRIKGIGQGNECHLSHMGMKFYDKALQNRLRSYILRIEVKVKKMQAFEKNRHFYLSDLLSEWMWDHFSNKLMTELESCIISDQVDPTLLTKRELDIFNKCENPRTWKSLDRTSRHRYKKVHTRIINQYGELKIKKILAIEINNKMNQLKPINYFQNATFLPNI